MCVYEREREREREGSGVFASTALVVVISMRGHVSDWLECLSDRFL